MDVVERDVFVDMVYYRESGHQSDAPPKLLLNIIERGELDVKTGKGFYSYPNPSYQDPSWLKGDSV